MTVELDALRAEVERIPIDEHWWVSCDSDGHWSVIWDNTSYMVWSAGDEEWCRAECERLNADPRAATILAALSGFVALTGSSGRLVSAVRLAEMLAHVRTEPLANACDLGLNDLYRVTGERDTARRDLECTQGAIASAITRAEQAEATRDAAQARATACEERARRAEAVAHSLEASRDEWREIATRGSTLVGDLNSMIDGYGKSEELLEWAEAVCAWTVDPAAGTGDHGREAGRNGE